MFASGIGTVALTAALARRLGRDPARAAALLGLSPVLLLAEVGGLHQDAPAVLCLVAAAWCLVRSREDATGPWVDVAAGTLVVAAAAIKPSFAIVAPVVVAGARGRTRALAGLLGAGAVVAAADLVSFGGAIPDLSTQGSLVTPLSVPNLLGLAAGHGGADAAVRGAARDVLAAIAILAAAAVALRRERAPAALAVVLLAAVLALPWVMPLVSRLGSPVRRAPAATRMGARGRRARSVVPA